MHGSLVMVDSILISVELYVNIKFIGLVHSSMQNLCFCINVPKHVYEYLCGTQCKFYRMP